MVKKLPQSSIEEKRKSAISKIIFVTMMGGLVGIMYVAGNMKAKEKPSKSNKELVRGVETSKETEELKEALAKQADSVKNTIVYYEDQLENITEKVIQDNKKQVEEKTSEIFYQTTIKPLLDKIHDLPEDQQENIKQELCR